MISADTDPNGIAEVISHHASDYWSSMTGEAVAVSGQQS